MRIREFQLLKLVYVFLMTVIVCSVQKQGKASVSPSLQEFFRPAPAASKTLPPDELYPQGRLLLYSLYSVGTPELEKSKADGFTAIGPYYGDMKRNRVIEKARQQKVKCLYTIGRTIAIPDSKTLYAQGMRIPGGTNRNYSSLRRLDNTKTGKINRGEYEQTARSIRQKVIAEVKAVASHREIAIWYVGHEELRFWRKNEMFWLSNVSSAIHSADPLHRPVMMYEPNHRNASALAHTVVYLDFCSKGMYCNSVGFKENRIWIRWSVEQEITAIKQANPSAIPIAVLWMAHDPDNPKDISRIKKWCRHDVYLSLISGAKGILIWSGYNRRKGFKNTFKDYYQGYASAARELNGQLNLARVFLFGQKRNDIKIDIISGPAVLKLDYDKKVHTYQSVNYYNAAYKNKRYLFLVNSSNSPVTVMLSNLPTSGINCRNILEKNNILNIQKGSCKTTLPALGVKCLVFTAVDY